MPNDGISFHELARSEGEPSGMTGDRDGFIVWGLSASEQQIDSATSDSLVRNNLFWLKGRTPRFNKTIEYFGRYSNYLKIGPTIVDLLADPDVRYAYTEYRVETNGDITYATMWICSPHAKKIAFFCGF
jgi:hypothetical protein